MPLTGTGRLDQPQASRTYIAVSAKLARDSQFPFKKGDKLAITIDGDRLIVERARGQD